MIRKRFDDETIEKLLELKWWDLPDDELRILLPDLVYGMKIWDNPAMLKPYLAQTDRLRAAVKNLKPEDLDRVAAVLGEDRLRETLAQVEGVGDITARAIRRFFDDMHVQNSLERLARAGVQPRAEAARPTGCPVRSRA